MRPWLIACGLLPLVGSGGLGCGAKSGLAETVAARDSGPPDDSGHSGVPDGSSGPVDVAIVQASETNVASCVDRFTGAFGAEAHVATIEPGADSKTFRSHDLVVVCSNWAENGSSDVLGRSGLYTEYVRDGGGLLLFQPNPFPLQSERIDLLPEWFVVATFYNDTTVSIVAPDHPVTRGLTATDMPYPADRITEFSPGWTELARGDQSGDGSLIVADIGRGRAALDASHHLRTAGDTDALIRRLGLWLTHRL